MAYTLAATPENLQVDIVEANGLNVQVATALSGSNHNKTVVICNDKDSAGDILWSSGDGGANTATMGNPICPGTCAVFNITCLKDIWLASPDGADYTMQFTEGDFKMVSCGAAEPEPEPQIEYDHEVGVDQDNRPVIRTVVYDEVTGMPVITYTDPITGIDVTGSTTEFHPEKNIDPTSECFKAIADGTGYSTGDIFNSVTFWDANDTPPSPYSSMWYNVTTGSVISAPLGVDVKPCSPEAAPFATQQVCYNLAGDTTLRFGWKLFYSENSTTYYEYIDDQAQPMVLPVTSTGEPDTGVWDFAECECGKDPCYTPIGVERCYAGGKVQAFVDCSTGIAEWRDYHTPTGLASFTVIDYADTTLCAASVINCDEQLVLATDGEYYTEVTCYDSEGEIASNKVLAAGNVDVTATITDYEPVNSKDYELSKKCWEVTAPMLCNTALFNNVGINDNFVLEPYDYSLTGITTEHGTAIPNLVVTGANLADINAQVNSHLQPYFTATVDAEAFDGGVGSPSWFRFRIRILGDPSERITSYVLSIVGSPTAPAPQDFGSCAPGALSGTGSSIGDRIQECAWIDLLSGEKLPNTTHYNQTTGEYVDIIPQGELKPCSDVVIQSISETPICIAGGDAIQKTVAYSDNTEAVSFYDGTGVLPAPVAFTIGKCVVEDCQKVDFCDNLKVECGTGDYTVGQSGDKRSIREVSIGGTVYDMPTEIGGNLDTTSIPAFTSWLQSSFGIDPTDVTITTQGGGVETIAIANSPVVFDYITESVGGTQVPFVADASTGGSEHLKVKICKNDIDALTATQEIELIADGIDIPNNSTAFVMPAPKVRTFTVTNEGGNDVVITTPSGTVTLHRVGSRTFGSDQDGSVISTAGFTIATGGNSNADVIWEV